MDLFAKMIKEPAMDQLRTKETLGYIVWSGVRCVRGDVQGIRVLVQGSREPAYLNERIEAFLKQFRQEIVDMPQVGLGLLERCAYFAFLISCEKHETQF